MSKTAHVYRVLNTLTGKNYIGWTAMTPQRRFIRHCRDARKGSPTHFHEAIRKHPSEVWRVLELAKVSSYEEAKCLEKQYIAEFNATDRRHGYNMTVGGDGMIDPTGEIAKKISATLKGRGKGIPKSPETRARMQGRITTPEASANMSRAQKAYYAAHPMSPERREKLAAAKRGRKRGPWSAEHRSKVSKIIREWWKERQLDPNQTTFEF
jgi:hypothetical protein